MLEDAKRKQITLLCFVLANVIFSTFLVFLDSYSVYIWEYETNVGPATMFMQSQAELPDEAAFMQIEGIEKAALMTKSWASLVAFPPDQNATSLASEAGDISALNGPAEPSINTTVKAIEMNLDLVTDFPTIFNLTEGKWPEEPWECAFAEWLANLFGVELGAIVTYESGFVHEYVQFRLVGIYSHPETDNRNQGYYVLGDTIVMPQYVSDRERTYYAYLKVKNLVLHPNLVSNALATLSEIEEDIRFLDPQYRLFHHTTFTLDDILGKGIQRYLVWISKTGIDQLIRSQVAIFVGIILTALTVRFNVKNQEDRIDLLTSRGASTNQTNILVVREIILLSLGSMLFALPLGLAISRVGLLAQGFFVFSAASIIETPVLVTIGTVLMAFAFSLVLPLVVFGSIKLQSRNTKLEGIENVKLAKLVRAIRLIRWDAAVVLISLGLTLGLWEIGSRLNNAPLLYSAIYILPVLMMIGLASLITRGMNFGSLVLSKRLHRILPKMSLEIGARRTGFDSKTSGFTILIFALVCSLAWNGVIVNSSLPHTALAHARFAIGGDVTFRLDTDYHDAFTELKENLSHISGVLS
ncbi:MAG: FtsX-like permease family protein, partial [Candidatus Thorarchaeota archaeon]